MMIPLLITLALQSIPECVLLKQPQLTAGDLAGKIESFASIPAQTVLSAAPQYGVRRDISITQLRQWASSYGIKLEASENVCVYRETVTKQDVPWQESLLEALESLFGWKPAPDEFAIVDTLVGAGPKGKLILERSGLHYDPRLQQYQWRGKLTSDSGYAVAQILFRVLKREKQVVTARPLPANKLITSADLEVTEVPFRPEQIRIDPLNAPAEGQVLRRSLPKGSVLLPMHLTQAPLIQIGDSVEIQSKAGQTTVRTAAVARSKARRGDPVLVATLEGKKLLRAIATGPGVVEIQSGPGKKTQ
jgi:flagella basal body P-ring formation protein FlgA